jgi:hypothetical protein
MEEVEPAAIPGTPPHVQLWGFCEVGWGVNIQRSLLLGPLSRDRLRFTPEWNPIIPIDKTKLLLLIASDAYWNGSVVVRSSVTLPRQRHYEPPNENI